MPIYLGNTIINDVFLGSSRQPEAYVGLTVSDTNAKQYLIASSLQYERTIAPAINQLCIDLKNANLFDKFYAIYPLAGYSADTTKYNLVNTGSLTLSFNAGWTFTNGITGNAINTYADTFFTASLSGWTGDNSVCVYIRNNTTNGYDFGAENAQRYYLISRDSSNNASYAVSASLSVASQTDSRGFWVGTVSGSAASNQVIYKNGSSIGSRTLSAVAGPDYSLYLGANNFRGLGANGISDRNYAFAAIGRGLSSTEVSSLYTIVQSYEVSMSRQV